MINSLDVLFTTDRFNVTEVKDHFINDCCFGEDLAAWLRIALGARGLDCEDSGQEDWGWYLPLAHHGVQYYLNCSAMLGFEPQTSDAAEWRIMVERKRTFKEKLKGTGRIHQDDPVFNWVLELCQSQPDFSNVRVETI